MTSMRGYKVFTHDLRSPVQGGEPVWDGTTPHILPPVLLDVSCDDCGSGWNFCARPETAFRIAGLWPDGQPSRLFAVEGGADAIVRGEKLRSSELTILSEVIDIRPAVEALSNPFDKRFRSEMVDEQMEWHAALAPMDCDSALVEQCLHQLLDARGFSWTIKRFNDAQGAWDARDVRDVSHAPHAPHAYCAWGAWGAQGVWNAWDAWGARYAWAALQRYYAVRMGWIAGDPKKYTVGIRDAYSHGLGIAIPTGPNELGWAAGTPSRRRR